MDKKGGKHGSHAGELELAALRGGIPRDTAPTASPDAGSAVPAVRGLGLGSAALRAISELLNPAQTSQEIASLPLSPPGWAHLGLKLGLVALCQSH